MKSDNNSVMTGMTGVILMLIGAFFLHPALAILAFGILLIIIAKTD